MLSRRCSGTRTRVSFYTAMGMHSPTSRPRQVICFAPGERRGSEMRLAPTLVPGPTKTFVYGKSYFLSGGPPNSVLFGLHCWPGPPAGPWLCRRIGSAVPVPVILRITAGVEGILGVRIVILSRETAPRVTV